MQVEWDPENGEPKSTWEFNQGDVLGSDAKLVEKHYGGSWDQWVQGLRVGEFQARAVLLWYMMKLVNPKLKFADLPDFRVRQLTVQMGVSELKELFERAKRMKMSPDNWEAFEAAFEVDLRDAVEREGGAVEAEVVDGKLVLESGGLPKQA